MKIQTIKMTHRNIASNDAILIMYVCIVYILVQLYIHNLKVALIAFISFIIRYLYLDLT